MKTDALQKVTSGQFYPALNAKARAELGELLSELAAKDAEIATLKFENEQLFQVAQRAMAAVLESVELESQELKELDRYMANEITDDLFNRLDGCVEIAQNKSEDE